MRDDDFKAEDWGAGVFVKKKAGKSNFPGRTVIIRYQFLSQNLIHETDILRYVYRS